MRGAREYLDAAAGRAGRLLHLGGKVTPARGTP
jgi:hypothetical protein